MSVYPADLPSLTRLRFFAALWVVFYHWRVPWTVDIDSVTAFFAMGRFGVDLFFILSGFVLAHVYVAAREQGKFDFAKFIIARFARIYPLHLATIVLLALAAFGAWIVGVPFEREEFPIADLPANLLMIHAWGFAPNPGWNAPSWSISAEWFAYLAFPAYLMIAIALARRPLALVTIAIVAFLVLDLVHRSLFGESLPMATERFGVLRIIPEFLLGIAIYRLGNRYPLGRVTAGFVFGASLIIYVTAAHLAWDDRVIALLGAPIVLSLAELDRHAAGTPKQDPVRYLGEISYAIYMLHVPFFMIAFNLLQDVMGVIDETISTMSLLALLAAMLAASSLTYEWLEKPSRRAIRRWGNARLMARRGNSETTR
ncbi:acyltransferase [Hyphobacterium sp. SN044]|uniref:acyltransferase family protein n=1 Tax=Hyphobacterium sp. SN044 TaxID=2912575 RepID=UPI001F1BA654|nr:acyltransferase [Hyphobacterium sp. SN044]MCF8880998.1 acyltransferase [Hyphobacterium sp. SN044]